MKSLEILKKQIWTIIAKISANQKLLIQIIIQCNYKVVQTIKLRKMYQVFQVLI